MAINYNNLYVRVSKEKKSVFLLDNHISKCMVELNVLNI